MSFKAGDWVRTERGEVGRITLVARLSAFVEIHEADNRKRMVSNLLSTLIRIEPPSDPQIPSGKK